MEVLDVFGEDVLVGFVQGVEGENGRPVLDGLEDPPANGASLV